MKLKKRFNNNQKMKHKDSNSEAMELQDDKKLWFTEVSDDPPHFNLASDEVVISLKEEAKKCLDSETVNYNIKNTKNNSDYRWMKTATQKGTISDRIAASTVLIQDNPITNLEMLRNLVSMVKVSKKNQCIVAIETLTELFLTCLLKPNIKLKIFHQRPLMLLSEISSGNALTRRKYLICWYFEDQLKEIYVSFVLALNTAAHDTVDANKEKALGAMYKLLEGNPEQEKNLLRNIVNKFGDRSQKVASKAIYCLNQLLFKHPNIQGVVLDEIEKLLFRPNIVQKAQYYSICFLSQFYLSHDAANVARKLIELYFSFFKACIKQGEVDSRMMSALLMGVNRAYPYAKLELQKFDNHLDTMYRIVHIANFNVSLHALMLLFQVSDYANNMNNRFYSALYKKLYDPKLITTTHQAMFLNLMYKALIRDKEVLRIKAFIKRLLQITLLMQPPFACGTLYLISQLISKQSDLHSIELQQADTLPLVKFEDNEEEKYVDVVDNDIVIKIEDEDNIEDNNKLPSENVENNNEDEVEVKPDIEILNSNMQQTSSWFHCATTIKQEKKDPVTYDPFIRNPLYAGADHTAYLELLILKEHHHPTVSLYAQNLLEGTAITYSGDPLKDFSLIRFLDRFVFKNPKKINELDGSHPTFGIRKKYKPVGLRALALNSEKYLQENEKNIPVDELFLYKFMQKKIQEKQFKDDESDLDSVASEEFEEMLNKMTDNKEFADDLDYMSEIGNNLKTKPSKKIKSNEEDANESDIGSDLEDIDEEEDDNEDIDSGSDENDELGPNEDDEKLIGNLDDDNISDIVFESDDDKDDMKMKRKMKKKKGDLNSVFASAEEFASLLEDEGNSLKASGSSHAFSNKDNANMKQIAWEEKRNHWLQGYKKAVGKKGQKFVSHENNYNKKRANKSKFNNKYKKQRVS